MPLLILVTAKTQEISIAKSLKVTVWKVTKSCCQEQNLIILHEILGARITSNHLESPRCPQRVPRGPAGQGRLLAPLLSGRAGEQTLAVQLERLRVFILLEDLVPSSYIPSTQVRTHFPLLCR